MSNSDPSLANAIAPAPPQGSISGSAPYARRIISLTFRLGTGSFGAEGSNQITITGLRVFCQISQATTPSPSNCQIRVYGLTLSHINQLTRVGRSYQVANNFVAVQAGDSLSGLTTIFNGTIYEAYPDFSDQPDSAFVITASPTAQIQMKPVTPVSFPGSVSVSSALQQILKPHGITLEANGASAMLASPYFPGTTWTQILRALQAANLFAYYDGVKKTLAVWPKTGSRAGSAIEISPRTGMINYPEFQKNRIRVRTLFDPQVRGLAPGMPIMVKSQFASANGNWITDLVEYNISAEAPGGPWEMLITAHVAGQ
jgi:hypothetical protein